MLISMYHIKNIDTVKRIKAVKDFFFQIFIKYSIFSKS